MENYSAFVNFTSDANITVQVRCSVKLDQSCLPYPLCDRELIRVNIACCVRSHFCGNNFYEVVENMEIYKETKE